MRNKGLSGSEPRRGVTDYEMARVRPRLWLEDPAWRLGPYSRQVTRAWLARVDGVMLIMMRQGAVTLGVKQAGCGCQDTP